MTFFLQILAGGLSSGAIYAAVALSWGIVFNVSRLLNFAQGEFVMLGGLLMITCQLGLHLPVALALIATVVGVTLVGLLLDVLTLRPARRLTETTAIIITLGATLVLREGAKVAWGKDPLALPQILGENPVRLGGVAIQTQSLLILVGTAILLMLLWLFFDRTLYGKAMRACADDPLGATLIGISPRAMRTLSFALGGAIGAIAGILLVPLVPMSWDRGTMIGVKGVIAAILGGMGNFQGAVVGGITVGLLEALAAGYISSQYKDIMVFAVLIVLLLVRPTGLLGSPALGQRTRV